MVAINLEFTNKIIKEFEDSMEKPKTDIEGNLFTGIDLGTAFIVLSVLDENGSPVCGAYRYASVVKDGMVVDYIKAVDIVRELKEEIEEKINKDLYLSGVAIPPGTENVDGGVVKNVAESAGFEVVKVLDEPTASNNVLHLKNGAVVDIGGGTTGISIIKNGKVTKVYDEATGGTHFSLVISGSNKISFEEAEELKRDYRKHKEIFPIVRPVVDKVISIIQKSIEGEDIEEIVLVGGTALLTDIEKYIEEKIKIKVSKPSNPMFATPLGIAFSLTEEESD